MRGGGGVLGEGLVVVMGVDGMVLCQCGTATVVFRVEGSGREGCGWGRGLLDSLLVVLCGGGWLRGGGN